MGVIVNQSIKGTLATYLGAAIGAVTTFFVLTRVLTSEEIGLTRVLVDAATLLSGLAQLGTNSSAMRFYPYFKDADHNDHGFFFWTVLVPLFGFALYGMLFWFLREPITSLFSDKSALFVSCYNFVFPIGFFILYSAVFETNANVLMRVAVPKFIKEVLIRVLTLGVYALYAAQMLDFDGFVVAFSSVYGIATLANIVYLLSLKKISFKPDFKHITPSLRKDYLLYSLFLITAALSGTITPYINSFFISMKMGLATTGVFAIAFYMAGMVEMPYRSLGAIARPLVADHMKNHNVTECNSLVKNVALHQFLVGAFILFLMWINIDLIFSILHDGEKYAAAKNVVLILGFTRLFNSVLSIGSTVLSYSRYYYYSLIFTLLLSVSAVVLNILLIPIWGMEGAVIASLLAYCIQYSLLLLVVKIKDNISLFCWPQLKCAIVILALFGLNKLWQLFVAPTFLSLSSIKLVNLFADSIVRTSVLGGLGMWVIYKWQISEVVNSYIIKYINQIKGKKHN
ncbi:MAG: oligosaccharide flippase family protein [Salinivirgaceae bacterium]|nr:oligosaccharide flippase family protein [Salinivirgaceae bacterium]